MKDNFTSINIILDRSGSMAKLSKETIEGFNKLLSDQKELKSEAVLTLATFNHTHELIHDFKSLESIPGLTATDYQPNGWTALLDAIGNTIDSVGAKLAAMPEGERPSKVLFVIITDGEENKSYKFTKEQILNKITHQKEKYNWEFLFSGTDLDQIAESKALGITNSVVYSADSIGITSNYVNINSGITSYRNTGKVVI